MLKDTEIENAKENEKLKALSQNIEKLTNKLSNLEAIRKDNKIKKREELNDLYDAFEEQSNTVVSKIEDLNRKPTIIITVIKILPEIPENFPKNFNIQIVYEDVTMTGNQKSADFDETIDDKFIVPLLPSQSARLEVWTTEEEPILYDKAIINFGNDISIAISEKDYTTETVLEINNELTFEYKIELQGIGFQTWLNNNKNFKEAEEERIRIRKQNEIKLNKIREKVEEKKHKFNNKFYEDDNIMKTEEYDLKGIEEIMNILDD